MCLQPTVFLPMLSLPQSTNSSARVTSMRRTRSATKTQALPTTLAVARPAVLTDVDLLTIILKFASALGIDRMMAARVWHVSMVWSVATKAVLASLSQDHTMWSRACRRDWLNKPPHRTFLVNQL